MSRAGKSKAWQRQHRKKGFEMKAEAGEGEGEGEGEGGDWVCRSVARLEAWGEYEVCGVRR